MKGLVYTGTQMSEIQDLDEPIAGADLLEFLFTGL